MTAASEPMIATPMEPTAPSTKRLAVYGTMWTVFGYGTSQFLRLVSNLILTRLLAPSVFGAMALVQIFILGLAMFSDLGVGPSVIRAKGNERDFLDTAWTIQFVRGWVLWAGCIALAEPIARFYHIPELRYLIMVVGFQAVIEGSQSMSIFTQNKKLAIKSLTLLNLGAQIIAMTVMIIAAFYLRSIWALVIGGITGVTLSALGSHLLLPGMRHRFCWNKAAVHELFNFGKWIFISTIFTFTAGQLDRMMLGKLVSLTTLGVYNVALMLATLPNAAIIHIASVVLYPVFARYADEPRESYVQKVLKARRLLLPIGAVVVGGLATIAQPFFHWLYDWRYADAGWIAQMLSIYIWFWMLQVSADRALVALGDTRSVSIGNFVNLVVTFAGCLLGYHLAGLPGFIIGLSFSSLCGHVVIEIALLKHGINIFRQDIIATAAVTIVTLAALYIGRVASSMVVIKWNKPVEWIVPNLVILGAGIWVTMRVKRELLARATA